MKKGDMTTDLAFDGPWREPAEETTGLYPKLVVHDGRYSGAITVGSTRLPLWCVVGLAAAHDWEEVESTHAISGYGLTERDVLGFLNNLLEVRGEFARLLLVLADAERIERSDIPWWAMKTRRKAVSAQLRRCLASLEEEV